VNITGVASPRLLIAAERAVTLRHMATRVIVLAIVVFGAPAAVACGSSQLASTSDGGGAAGDASGGPWNDSGVANACDDLFAAWVACSLVPPSAVAHDAPRFRQFCEIQASLPGSTTTAADIEACAHAFMADCSATCQGPTTGTLPAGAACNVSWDLQCQSGACAQLPLPDGGYSACGICAASVAVGQPCDGTSPSACEPGSYCAGSTSRTCVTYGAVGAPCSSTLFCQADLRCSSAHQCEPRVSLGGACQTDVDCSDALPCVGGTCTARADAGAHCTPSGYALPCNYGLECAAATSTCVAPTVQPGGPGGANGQLCVHGSCSAKGVCPTIIPDGQPCPTNDTELCDFEAHCDSAGTCSIPGATICR
jgi:hypothetical protein